MELNDVDNDMEDNREDVLEHNINEEGKLVFNQEFCIDSDENEDIAIMDV